MFGSWPTAAKWIAICMTVLALLGTFTAGYFAWESRITRSAQLDMLTKALAKQIVEANARRGIENDVARLPPDRLLICNSASPGDIAFDCCYADRKCLPLEAPK